MSDFDIRYYLNFNFSKKLQITKKMIICIEGNIGAGKSTVLDILKKRGYTVYEENLNSWGDILSQFYKDPTRWTFTLQVAILADMYDQYQDIKSMSKGIVFIERSPDSSNIFALNAKAEGKMDDIEYRIYYDLFKKLSWKPYKSFMINTDVDTCFDRMKRRSRMCEKDIRKDYLQKLADRFDMLEMEKIDGTQTPDKIVDEILDQI
jgi:deoxyadenosine/deoxycytidine kinase